MEHHSQLVISTSGLQGFPLKMFEHGCKATCISISICYISRCPSLNHLELIDVILGVWDPDLAAVLQYGSYKGEVCSSLRLFIADF